MRWVLSRADIGGNDIADEWAKDANYLRETSFARGRRPPMPIQTADGSRKLRKELRHERKAVAGCYDQLLSGHAATSDYSVLSLQEYDGTGDLLP